MGKRKRPAPGPGQQTLKQVQFFSGGLPAPHSDDEEEEKKIPMLPPHRSTRSRGVHVQTPEDRDSDETSDSGGEDPAADSDWVPPAKDGPAAPLLCHGKNCYYIIFLCLYNEFNGD